MLDYSPSISTIYKKNGKIIGCFLVSEEGDSFLVNMFHLMSRNMELLQAMAVRSLLNLTNKFYNAAPVEIQSTPVIEKEKKKSKAVKSKRPGLFAPDDVRKVTKVSSLDHPDMSGAPFDKLRTVFWIKVSKIFSSKKAG